MPRTHTSLVVVARAAGVALAFGVLVVALTTEPAAPTGDECAMPTLAPATLDLSEPLEELEEVESSSNLSTDAPVATVPRRPERPGAAGTCPRDMALVDGDECSEVDQPCLEWAQEAPGEEEKMRCMRFGPSRCTGTRTHIRFCIDRYEYPNVRGRVPVVMKTWVEAQALCAGRGRRLCKGGEWTLACEGEERLPYPYGYERDDNACNTDRPLAGPYPRMFKHRPRGVSISLVDWRSPSGAMERCESPYGVYDMTGNVDEWVVNESGRPYESGLKGGYWGPVRDRCRPMTTAHDEQFAFYQIGFRCCEDARPVAASK